MAAKSASSRVSKRSGSGASTSARTTRSRGKMSTAGGSGSGGVLERMVEEAKRGVVAIGAGNVGDGGEEMDVDVDVDGEVAIGEGEDGDGVVLRDEELNLGVEMESQGLYEGKGKGKSVLPAQDNVLDNKPFRLFELPTEIRLEIYRACLTRPYKILLSKVVEPAPKVGEKVESADDDSLGEDLSEKDMQARHGQAGSMLPPLQMVSRRRGGNRGVVARPVLRASRSSASTGSQAGTIIRPNASTSSNTSHRPTNTVKHTTSNPRPRISSPDPLIIPLLRTTKTVYKEARDILYGENHFMLDLATAVPTLAALHQRSRRRIKHVELEIRTYTEILESFSETVRLSLRYCFGLRRLVVRTPFLLPGGGGGGEDAGGNAGTGQGGGGGGNGGGGVSAPAVGGNTTVYANGFDILRWLPQGCEVVLEGQRNWEIDAVVGRHMRLAGLQDKVSPLFWLQHAHGTAYGMPFPLCECIILTPRL